MQIVEDSLRHGIPSIVNCRRYRAELHQLPYNFAEQLMQFLQFVTYCMAELCAVDRWETSVIGGSIASRGSLDLAAFKTGLRLVFDLNSNQLCLFNVAILVLTQSRLWVGIAKSVQ
jgi:hypothetical protein